MDSKPIQSSTSSTSVAANKQNPDNKAAAMKKATTDIISNNSDNISSTSNMESLGKRASVTKNVPDQHIANVSSPSTSGALGRTNGGRLGSSGSQYRNSRSAAVPTSTSSAAAGPAQRTSRHNDRVAAPSQQPTRPPGKQASAFGRSNTSAIPMMMMAGPSSKALASHRQAIGLTADTTRRLPQQAANRSAVPTRQLFQNKCDSKLQSLPANSTQQRLSSLQRETVASANKRDAGLKMRDQATKRVSSTARPSAHMRPNRDSSRPNLENAKERPSNYLQRSHTSAILPPKVAARATSRSCPVPRGHPIAPNNSNRPTAAQQLTTRCSAGVVGGKPTVAKTTTDIMSNGRSGSSVGSSSRKPVIEAATRGDQKVAKSTANGPAGRMPVGSGGRVAAGESRVPRLGRALPGNQERLAGMSVAGAKTRGKANDGRGIPAGYSSADNKQQHRNDKPQVNNPSKRHAADPVAAALSSIRHQNVPARGSVPIRSRKEQTELRQLNATGSEAGKADATDNNHNNQSNHNNQPNQQHYHRITLTPVNDQLRTNTEEVTNYTIHSSFETVQDSSSKRPVGDEDIRTTSVAHDAVVLASEVATDGLVCQSRDCAAETDRVSAAMRQEDAEATEARDQAQPDEDQHLPNVSSDCTSLSDNRPVFGRSFGRDDIAWQTSNVNHHVSIVDAEFPSSCATETNASNSGVYGDQEVESVSIVGNSMSAESLSLAECHVHDICSRSLGNDERSLYDNSINDLLANTTYVVGDYNTDNANNNMPMATNSAVTFSTATTTTPNGTCHSNCTVPVIVTSIDPDSNNNNNNNNVNITLLVNDPATAPGTADTSAGTPDNSLPLDDISDICSVSPPPSEPEEGKYFGIFQDRPEYECCPSSMVADSSATDDISNDEADQVISFTETTPSALHPDHERTQLTRQTANDDMATPPISQEAPAIVSSDMMIESIGEADYSRLENGNTTNHEVNTLIFDQPIVDIPVSISSSCTDRDMCDVPLIIEADYSQTSANEFSQSGQLTPFNRIFNDDICQNGVPDGHSGMFLESYEVSDSIVGLHLDPTDDLSSLASKSDESSSCSISTPAMSESVSVHEDYASSKVCFRTTATSVMSDDAMDGVGATSDRSVAGDEYCAVDPRICHLTSHQPAWSSDSEDDNTCSDITTEEFMSHSQHQQQQQQQNSVDADEIYHQLDMLVSHEAQDQVSESTTQHGERAAKRALSVVLGVIEVNDLISGAFITEQSPVAGDVRRHSDAVETRIRACEVEDNQSGFSAEANEKHHQAANDNSMMNIAAGLSAFNQGNRVLINEVQRKLNKADQDDTSGEDESNGEMTDDVSSMV